MNKHSHDRRDYEQSGLQLITECDRNTGVTIGSARCTRDCPHFAGTNYEEKFVYCWKKST